jgi:hypothetical protein
MALHKIENEDPKFEDHYYKDHRRQIFNLKSSSVKKLLLLQLSNTLTCLGSFYLLFNFFEFNIFIGLAVSIGFSLITVAITTSKVLGVVDKIENHIKEINSGKIYQFKLRKNDLFKDLEICINELNQNISKLNRINKPSNIAERDFKVIKGDKDAA